MVKGLDFNNDGQVNILDMVTAIKVVEAISSLSPEQKWAALIEVRDKLFPANENKD